MSHSIVELLFLAFAAANIIFGALVVFSNRALNFLERTIWKQTDEEQKMLPETAMHTSSIATRLDLAHSY